MSTLASANFAESDEDDERDDDYRPAEGSSRPKSKGKAKAKSTTTAKPSHLAKRNRVGDAIVAGDGHESDSATDSGSSDSGSGADDDDDAERKALGEEQERLRHEAAEAEENARRARAKDLFAAMQGDAGGEASVPRNGKSNGGEEEMVEIKRARKFAGEVIYETVKVHKSDPEAITYLASIAPPSDTPTAPAAPETPKDASSTSHTDLSTPLPSSFRDPPRPKAGPPPRKKPRQSLEAMAAGLGKAKKMTTLEKSQMDWKSHLSTSTAEADELEGHRRTGGYLDKRDFLDRVGDRRAESFEQNRRK